MPELPAVSPVASYIADSFTEPIKCSSMIRVGCILKLATYVITDVPYTNYKFPTRNNKCKLLSQLMLFVSWALLH